MPGIAADEAGLASDEACAACDAANNRVGDALFRDDEHLADTPDNPALFAGVLPFAFVPEPANVRDIDGQCMGAGGVWHIGPDVP